MRPYWGIYGDLYFSLCYLFSSIGSDAIGTGPGVIPMDGFSPGYSSNMGRPGRNMNMMMQQNHPGMTLTFDLLIHLLLNMVEILTRCVPLPNLVCEMV